MVMVMHMDMDIWTYLTRHGNSYTAESHAG